MNKEEAAKQLRELQAGNDPEGDHCAADVILCEVLKSLGCGDVVCEFEKIKKWYA